MIRLISLLAIGAGAGAIGGILMPYDFALGLTIMIFGVAGPYLYEWASDIFMPFGEPPNLTQSHSMNESGRS